MLESSLDATESTVGPPSVSCPLKQDPAQEIKRAQPMALA